MTYQLGRVIDHVHLRVSDLEASRTFYRAICTALNREDAWRDEGDHFMIDELYFDAADDDVSRIHLAFQASTAEDVDAFFRLTTAAGGRPNGAPGFRSYHNAYYAAFVLDPDGNNIEAVCDVSAVRDAVSVKVERIGTG
ncbi:VOC family protein [Neorhizobium sp. NPDC001467]|uniref:VOC family protein n=1 Tax=Neorhizobium sp. NPDC001467 TaxID=3390595 RepID=UPI003D006F17